MLTDTMKADRVFPSSCSNVDINFNKPVPDHKHPTLFIVHQCFLLA